MQMNTLETRTRLYASIGDRYHIERTLGEGGLATVYLARDLKHGHDVAIKVLNSDAGDAVGAERFLRELRLAATLSHPNIVPLFDWGDANETLFTVMPRVQGRSLRDELDATGARRLPLDEALRITSEIAAALDYAHDHGVLHRDIRPENILLEHGRALLADFGFGNALAGIEGNGLTRSGVAISDPAYASPEQIAGEPVGARSDLYSLACVLYEMLAGEAPYPGPVTQVVISKRFMQTPPSVAVMRDDIPRPLACALQRALARSPSDRYDTARAFVQSLSDDEATQSLPTPARSLATT
jgi:serine/threonine protein kinase